MAIQELTAVVKPPEDPLEAGPKERWEAIQAELGTKLPTDFRDFGLAYGTGKFVEQGIWVFNPFAAVFLQDVEEHLGIYRSLKEEEGEVPFGIFPDIPGLLPWGTDENGSGMHWLTEGDPDHWPVLIRSRESAKYHRFDMRVTTFLAKIIKGKIILPGIWPKEFFEDPARLVFRSG